VSSGASSPPTHSIEGSALEAPAELSSNEGTSGLGRRPELLVILAFFAVGAWLRWLSLTAAGAFWRDEAHSVMIAADWSEPLYADSFPILWIATLRSWLAVVGADADDFSIRLCGALIGLALPVVAVWSTRLRQGDIPWTALALLTLHPVVVIFGGETRGYGLGVLLGLFMAGSIVRLALQAETPLRWGLALLATLLAVQASFTNSSVCAGFVCAGCAVRLFNGQPLAALRLLLIGIIAAATMLPYAVWLFPLARDWAMIVWGQYSYFDLIRKAWFTLVEGGLFTALVWVAAGLSPLVALAINARRVFPGDEFTRRVIFAATALVIATVGIFVYHRFLRVPTQTWYYLPLMSVIVFCSDLIIPVWSRGPIARRGLMLGAFALAGWNLWVSGPLVRHRLTNVDLIARQIATKADPEDLVVLHPFYYAISFTRYYAGPAPWMTIPDMPRKVAPYGYSVVKAAMTRPEQIDPELARIRAVLHAGHRVWLISSLAPLEPDEDPGRLPTAPNSPYGWSEGAYSAIWGRQLTSVLRDEGLSLRVDRPTTGLATNVFEFLPLYEIRGGRKPATPPR
jgi:hypothetical protein